jgi:hypothetical protein
VFRSQKLGCFTFSLEHGFGKVSDLDASALASLPLDDMPAAAGLPTPSKVLNFGDVWMVDQIYRQSGLETVLDNLIPGFGDTLKSLVAFRLL